MRTDGGLLSGRQICSPAAGPKSESVAVVDLGAPIGGVPPVVGPVPVHAGERCDAEPRDVLTDEERRRHVDHGAAFLRRLEPVGAREARPVEQRENRDCRGCRARARPARIRRNVEIPLSSAEPCRPRCRAPRHRIGSPLPSCGNSWRLGRPASRCRCRAHPSRGIRRSRARPAVSFRARSCRSRNPAANRDLERLSSGNLVDAHGQRVELIEVEEAHGEGARPCGHRARLGRNLIFCTTSKSILPIMSGAGGTVGQYGAPASAFALRRSRSKSKLGRPPTRSAVRAGADRRLPSWQRPGHAGGQEVSATDRRH